MIKEEISFTKNRPRRI